ncbi:MAG: hypothetical protein WCK93_07590 [Nitrosomonadales bacterium]
MKNFKLENLLNNLPTAEDGTPGTGVYFGTYPHGERYWIDIENNEVNGIRNGPQFCIGFKDSRESIEFHLRCTPREDGLISLGYLSFSGIETLTLIRDALTAVIDHGDNHEI